MPHCLRALGIGGIRGSGLEVMDQSATQVETVPDCAFEGCGVLRALVLPRGLKTLANCCLLWSGVQALDLSATGMDEFHWGWLVGAHNLRVVLMSRILRAFLGHDKLFYSSSVSCGLWT
jgi:hypothetical protein